MTQVDIKEVGQLLSDAKYVIACASIFNKSNGIVQNVSLMGFSNKKSYQRSFKNWNTGLNDFYHDLVVRDGKLYDGKGLELRPDWLFNRTTKYYHRKHKELMA